MDQYSIHETVIRDIVDVIADLKKSDEIEMFFSGRQNRKYFKSISNATSNLTLVFPVIASSSLSIDTVSIVAKAIERKAVTMLQMLFSAISITDANNAFDQVRRVHTNLRLSDKMTIDDFIDTMDKFVDEGTIIINNKEVYDAVREDMKMLSYTLPENVSESSLASYRLYNSPYSNEVMVLNEAKDDVIGDKNTIRSNNRVTKDSNNRTTTNSNNRTSFNNITNNYGGGGSGRKKSSISGDWKDLNDTFNKQLMPTDVKKANELVPSMMIVNFVNNEGEEPIGSAFVIGVKAKIYPVDSMDMINRIILKNNDKKVLQQFIRATTREISFMRDFIFAIDRAKIDALSQSRRGSSSKLWKVLERRAKKDKMRMYLNQTNDASAISTLVISQEEVEYIKKNEGFDIEKPMVIRPIMESYNLMSTVIVDEGMEVAKFIFDTGEDIYEHIGFNLLEREASDSSYKKVINLISKMNKY